MFSVVVVVVCSVCWCCHRNLKNRAGSMFGSRWLENDANMDIYSVEQCYDTSGLFNELIPADQCSIPTTTSTQSNHGPPPSYDMVVAMDEQAGREVLKEIDHNCCRCKAFLNYKMDTNSKMFNNSVSQYDRNCLLMVTDDDEVQPLDSTNNNLDNPSGRNYDTNDSKQILNVSHFYHSKWNGNSQVINGKSTGSTINNPRQAVDGCSRNSNWNCQQCDKEILSSNYNGPELLSQDYDNGNVNNNNCCESHRHYPLTDNDSCFEQETHSCLFDINENVPSTSSDIPSTSRWSNGQRIVSSISHSECCKNVAVTSEPCDKMRNLLNCNHNINNNSNNNNIIDLETFNENGLIRMDMSQIIDKTGLPTYEAALKLESSGYV